MRPIDADAAIKDIEDSIYTGRKIRRWLKEFPSAQPERKIGTWTKDASCPFCGFQPWYERDIHTLSFCPNCGADMRPTERNSNV